MIKRCALVLLLLSVVATGCERVASTPASTSGPTPTEVDTSAPGPTDEPTTTPPVSQLPVVEIPASGDDQPPVSERPVVEIPAPGDDQPPVSELPVAEVPADPPPSPPAVPVAATADPALVAAEDFVVPAVLPDAPHGTLLLYTPLVGYAVPDADAFRTMYLSESLVGAPIAVTGLAIVPRGAAPTRGRRLLAMAHGTTGVADDCAPSAHPAFTEITLAAPYVAAGYLVSMTDYEGLGTPGRHPYLVGESEGRSTLDAMLAATALPAADAGDEVAIAGFSQGGHAALWANRIAADWAPRLTTVGTFAGAPPVDLPALVERAATTRSMVGLVFLVAAGYQAAYPALDPAGLLTPAGVARLDSVDAQCGAPATQLNDVPLDQLVLPVDQWSPIWAQLLVDNDPGWSGAGPILIEQSATDELLPIAWTEAFVAQSEWSGAAVELREFRGGQAHGAIAPAAFADALAWFDARF